MDIKKTPKNAEIFICKECDFVCSKQSDWSRHILRPKHIKNINNIKKQEKAHKCNCGKVYKYYSGLWKHLKTCNKLNEPIQCEENVIEILINENKDFKNIILDLVKSNNDLQKQMIEICKNNKNTVINTNSNNNSNNKTFNLHFFLNEECKDAMNMSEFINTIQLKLSDLENIGKLGYIEGMSNIIIKQLNNTELNKRPVHCSDAKRETLYVKDEDKWEKEGPENKKMIKAVRGVDKKNYQMLNAWKTTYPKCLDSKSKQNDEYMILMSKVMDGDAENVNKVIKKVAKEVIIDK